MTTIPRAAAGWPPEADSADMERAVSYTTQGRASVVPPMQVTPVNQLTEREIARLRELDPFSIPDRNLEHPVVAMLDAPTLEALDRVVKREGWEYRSAFVRSLVVSALRQRGVI